MQRLICSHFEKHYTMAPSFLFLEDIAIADAAFEARGDTLAEVFEGATQAIIELMVDPQTVSRRWRQEIRLHERDTAELLFDWLSHLVFLKDAQSVIYREAQISLHHDEVQQGWHLHGVVIGDTIDSSHQSLRSDIKAVTKYQYSLAQSHGQWVARVVLDL